MRVVVALGGNALLKRGEPMSAEAQRANVRKAAAALADLATDHDIIVAHGSGPQVGLLALQAAALKEVPPYPLDVISAESIGMIGYVIEQELANVLPSRHPTCHAADAYRGGARRPRLRPSREADRSSV